MLKRSIKQIVVRFIVTIETPRDQNEAKPRGSSLDQFLTLNYSF